MEKQVLNRLLKQTEEIAVKAGNNALSKQKHSKRIESQGRKMKGDYATDVDLENEKLILNELKKVKPLFPVFSEEEFKRPDADTYWVVDPLDGTKNYYPGLPLWSVNIALYDAKNKDILLGVVYFPAFNHLFSSYKNGGAYLNKRSISPSKLKDSTKAIILIEAPNITTAFIGEKEYRILQRKNYRIRSWGIGAELCYVASGAFDAFFDFAGTTRDYDIFAPMAIAKEAGCKIEQFNPDEAPERRIIKVTNGKLVL